MEAMEEQAMEKLLADYRLGRDIDRMELPMPPDKDAVLELLEGLRRVLFPGYWGGTASLRALSEQGMLCLKTQLTRVFQSVGLLPSEAARRAADTAAAFFDGLPEIRAMLQLDLQAAYDGDPAAESLAEIVFCYPGFAAITVYRLAHRLWMLEVPTLPRMMTECAHSATGIDIHPGATIGKYFFIDHGTGIVIGETTVIGEHVKIYQGVTLGALSTRGGQSLRGKKRHPTIEDGVTIYAGASVLGGETVIGRDCVIGSNAFLTKSVAPRTTVTIQNQELHFKARPGSEGAF